MRTNKPITISQIKTRQRALSEQSVKESVSDAYYLYDIVKNSITSKSSMVREDAFKFFKGCVNRKNANKYVDKCLSIMESVDENISLILEGLLINEIIPYIDNLNAFKRLVESHKVLSESSRDRILDATKTNIICDRILNNSAKISSRFNIDKFIKENANRSYENSVLKICSMIDTYNMPSYGKLNIALEEVNYFLQKNAIKYDKSRAVQLITEYFINSSNNSNIDLKDFKSVLRENCCIEDEDLDKINYFVEDFEMSDEVPMEDVNPYDTKSTVININTDNNALMAFNAFKLSLNKSVEYFDDVLEIIFEENEWKIVEVLPEILDWLRNFAVIEFEGDDTSKYCTVFYNHVKGLYEIKSDTKIQCFVKLLDIFETELTRLNTIIDDNRFTDYSKVITNIVNDLRNNSKLFKEVAKSESAKAVMESTNEDVMTLSEFKIFKFENLITCGLKLDKALARKENKFLHKVKNKVKEVFKSAKEWLKEDYDITNITSENLIDCITEDFHFDHIVAIYEISTDVEEVKEAFDAFCIEMSNLFNDKNIHVYTESIDNLLEIHIADTTFISLTESENEEWCKVFTEAEQAYAGYLLSIAESLDKFANMKPTNLAEDFAEIESTLDAEGILGIIEASKYLNGMISYGRLQEIAHNYADNNPVDYMGNSEIYQALDHWKLEESSLDMVIDTVSLLREAIDSSLLVEAEKKSNVKSATGLDLKKKDDKPKPSKDKGSDGKEEKVEKAKINFNTLKYAMITMNQKAKSAGDKATQFSNTLNMYIEKFITSVKKLYTNDDREQIIKGSIIPSFHQLMGRLLVTGGTSAAAGAIAGSKAAQAAGIGLFGFSATAAIFTAVVSIFVTIAISKHSTEKERALMLDELQIELDICEKELTRAENAGQMKKYKALMYRQAKLKREYQRIKYNLKLSDYSKVGLKNNND